MMVSFFEEAVYRLLSEKLSPRVSLLKGHETDLSDPKFLSSPLPLLLVSANSRVREAEGLVLSVLVQVFSRGSGEMDAMSSAAVLSDKASSLLEDFEHDAFFTPLRPRAHAVHTQGTKLRNLGIWEIEVSAKADPYALSDDESYQAFVRYEALHHLGAESIRDSVSLLGPSS